jgi:hypothetical protein
MSSTGARTAPSAWYATDPSVLADASAIGAIERAVTNTRRGAARRLVERLEDLVARAPDRYFSFDPLGSATLTTSDGSFGAGHFTTPTIAELVERVAATHAANGGSGKVRLSILHGAHALTDIGTLQATALAGTLFQVASQFNCLEAPGPRIVAVRAYLDDHTQGPRASISALPGTLLRHYSAPAAGGGRFVQSDERCIDLLADVFDRSIAVVRSGYLQVSNIHDPEKLAARLVDDFERLRVGVHDDVEVLFGHDWDGPVPARQQRVAQVLTSTMALGSYSREDGSPALALARRQVLRGAYLGTLLSALSLQKSTVVLTMIGGGVFGNPRAEIWEAIRWAISQAEPLVRGTLDVVVNTREPLAAVDCAEVQARGGHIARFSDGGISVDA